MQGRFDVPFGGFLCRDKLVSLLQWPASSLQLSAPSTVSMLLSNVQNIGNIAEGKGFNVSTDSLEADFG